MCDAVADVTTTPSTMKAGAIRFARKYTANTDPPVTAALIQIQRMRRRVLSG
jgi:hypothetical protein